MTVETTESEQLQVLGDKDEDGVASGVESLIFDDGQGNTTFVTLNTSNSLMDTISMLSGTYLHFDWNENVTEVYVTAVSPGGTTQVAVNIDLSDIDTDNRSRRDADVLRSSSNAPSEMSKTSRVQSKIQWKSSLTKRQAGGIAKVRVTVTRCNQPEPNAQVFAIARLNYKNIQGRPQWTGESKYMAVRSSFSGVYYVKIPIKQSSMLGKKAAKVCRKIVQVLGHGCTVVSAINPALEQRICIRIALAVDVATTVAPGDSLVVLAACKAGFRAFRYYCKNFGSSPVPGGSSPADLICESIPIADGIIDHFQTTSIYLQPYAIFPAGNRVNAVGKRLQIQPGTSGVLPYSFTIEDANNLPVLKLLTVTPTDPAPFQDYIVNARYTCATSSVTVTMRIVGTDGYTSSTFCYGNTPSSCALYVPGAAALIVDRVTVTITETTKQYSFTREVVVVF